MGGAKRMGEEDVPEKRSPENFGPLQKELLVCSVVDFCTGKTEHWHLRWVENVPYEGGGGSKTSFWEGCHLWGFPPPSFFPTPYGVLCKGVPGRPSRKSPKSAFFALFCLFALFPEGVKSTWEIQKTEEKGLFPQICLNPHLLNPHLRHSKLRWPGDSQRESRRFARESIRRKPLLGKK